MEWTITMATFDVELALTSPRFSIAELEDVLSDAYCVEDRTENGWGYVVTAREESEAASLDGTVEEFLKGLDNIETLTFNSGAILRVAVFSNTASTTILLKCQHIARFGAIAEISFYATDE